MEQILVSLCLATLLAFLLLKQLLKKTSTTTTTKPNLPPSPWRIPLIGNLHQLSLPPHHSLQSLSLRYGPVMLLHFGSVPVLVVSSAEAAQDIMKTHDLKSANRPQTKTTSIVLKGGRDLILSPSGEYWRHMKSLCVTHLLNTKMVGSFKKIREEEISLVMGKLEKASCSSSSVNLSEIIFSLINSVIYRVALGKKYSSEESVVNAKKAVRIIASGIGAFPVGDYIPCLAWIDRIRGFNHQIEATMKIFFDFVEKLVQEHKERGNNNKEKLDFIDMLLWIQKEKTSEIAIDMSDMRIIILDVLIAGTITTSTLLEWTMTELIRHPKAMKQLKDEISKYATHESYVSEEKLENMKYLKAVIKEVLRLHPPGPILLPRQLSEDIKLEGYDIMAGTQVIINAWAIQRDTATWGLDAEEFKPERHLDSPLDFQGQNFKYIPFGSGRRLCPGIGFATTLAEVTLANLVNQFDWRVEARTLGDDDQYHLAEATGIEVCRKFPLIAFPSSPISIV